MFQWATYHYVVTQGQRLNREGGYFFAGARHVVSN